MRACTQCGKCCIAYADGGLSASPEEIEDWAARRPDIARFVSDGRIWCDPDTGELLPYCPWLRSNPEQDRYHCSIYEDRPQDCRDYPVLVEDMVKDGCEMLEARDLKNLIAVQRSLDLGRRGLA